MNPFKNFKKRKDSKPGILKKNSKLEILKPVIIIAIIVAVIYAILWQTGMFETISLVKQVREQQNIQKEDLQVLKKLKQIIDLPDDSQPLMAIVSDAKKLQESQPTFFAKAKDGDRLIVYPDLAILYDYNANKIIHVGPVDFGQAKIGTVSFALHNGSGDDATFDIFEEKLTSTFNNAVVTVKNTATKQYDETLVIDLIGENTEISKIADSLGGKVSDLPAGEIAPENVNVLIILGKDQITQEEVAPEPPAPEPAPEPAPAPVPEPQPAPEPQPEQPTDNNE